MSQLNFNCKECGVDCKDEIGVHTHMLFVHKIYMQPCGTSVAIRQMEEATELRVKYGNTLRRHRTSREYLIKKFRDMVKIKYNNPISQFNKIEHLDSILKKIEGDPRKYAYYANCKHLRAWKNFKEICHNRKSIPTEALEKGILLGV